jgi:hypothetical protein
MKMSTKVTNNQCIFGLFSSFAKLRLMFLFISDISVGHSNIYIHSGNNMSLDGIGSEYVQFGKKLLKIKLYLGTMP